MLESLWHFSSVLVAFWGTQFLLWVENQTFSMTETTELLENYFSLYLFLVVFGFN